MSRTNHRERAEKRRRHAPYCVTKRGRAACAWCCRSRLHANAKRLLSAREQERQ